MNGSIKNIVNRSLVITIFCIASLFGVVLSNYGVVGGIELLIAGLFILVLSLVVRLRVLLVMAIIAGLFVGIWRGSVDIAKTDKYRDFIGDDVLVSAVIEEDPSVKNNSLSISLTNIKLKRLSGQYHKMTGNIWVKLPDNSETRKVRRYDRVLLQGILNNGFGIFRASLNSAKMVFYKHVNSKDPLGNIRNYFSRGLEKVLNKEELALGMGLIAGQKSGLSDKLQLAFIGASLTHILVASGYNLTVLIRFSRRLFSKRSRLVALICSAILVGLFAGLVGDSASMDRAVLVAVLSISAWYVGRKIHPVVLLSVVAFLTIINNPIQLAGGVGWYLSFTSFIGVVILAPLLNSLITKRIDNKLGLDTMTIADKLNKKFGKIGGSLVQVLVETISAQIMAMPVIAIFMNSLSLVGPLSNVVVLPLLPLVMALTFISGIASIILPTFIAAIVAWPAARLLDYILTMANWFGGLSLSKVEINFDWKIWVAYYLLMLLVVLFLKKKTGHNFYRDNVVD